MTDINRRNNETLFQYKVRLFQNRHNYGLSWEDVRDILNEPVHSETIKKSARGYLQAFNDLTNTKFDNSILFLNDIHLPFERPDIFEILNKHKNQITHLFIGGDLLDCYDISVFTHDNKVDIVNELIYGYKWLKTVRDILGENIPIYVIMGNHEERFKKLVLKDKILQNFINPNILEMYQDGFKLFIGGAKKYYAPIANFHYIDNWYVNIDEKIVYGHPRDYSNIDGKMTEKFSEYMLNKNESAAVYIFGHTHKYCQQTVSRRQNVYVIENGCLCMPMEYSNCGKLNYTSQHYCYTIIRYNNGESINFNNISVYHLDEIDSNNKGSIIKL